MTSGVLAKWQRNCQAAAESILPKGKQMKKPLSVAVYALHPITYQTPIFEFLHQRLQGRGQGEKLTVLFGDDLSLRPVFYEHLAKEVTFDHNLRLDKFDYKIVKNYSKDSRKGFFSRINPGIFWELVNGRHDILIIHGYETFSAWLSLFFAKLLFRKTIFRGEAVLEGTPYTGAFVQRIKGYILPVFFFFIDAVMYSCQGNKRYFEHFGMKKEKMFPLPCAVNNDFYINKEKELTGKEGQIRQELGLDESHVVILFAARFTARKRPLDLIEAIRRIDNENITVIFAGDGPEKENMEKAAAAAEISAVFTGFVGPDRLSELCMVSDLCVVISSKDPSPKAMNEAMVFSLPIIVTDVVGTAYDLVRDGENGFIVNVGDIDEIACKIETLCGSPSLRAEMGAASRRIVEKWNFDAGVDGILAAVDHVMGVRPGDSAPA